MSAGLFYAGMATASVFAAVEGNRTAMFIAAAWAFDVLFTEARRRVARGRRA